MLSHPLRTPRDLVCVLFSSLLILVLVSCYSATKNFAGFKEETSEIERVVLAHEAMILNDIEGNRDFIHIQDNARAIEWIHSSVKQILERKGYVVSDQSIWSIGLSEKPDTPVLVYTDGVDEWPGFFSSGKLVERSTPVAVKLFGIDESKIDTFGSLHRHLRLESENLEEMKGTFYSSYIRELDLPPNSALLVTQSFGERIFTGKKIAEFLLSLAGAVAGPNFAGGWESDSTTQIVYILHSESGELLWVDYLNEIGGNRSESALKNGLEKLFSKLPDRISK